MYVFERMAILEPLLICLTLLALLAASCLHPLKGPGLKPISGVFRGLKPPAPSEAGGSEFVAPSASLAGSGLGQVAENDADWPKSVPLRLKPQSNGGIYGMGEPVPYRYVTGKTTPYQVFSQRVEPSATSGFQALARRLLPGVFLGLLLPAIVLTKTTGICLFPAIAYMVWARAGYRLRTALRLAAIPSVMAAAIWLGYFGLFVRPHYLADYRYLFSANAYTGIELEPFATVILNTFSDGMWMGRVLYPVFFGVIALGLFWRPRLLVNPLVPALLLWTGGYFAFLGYHNNLQPRYYLVVAVPITLLVALGLDCFREARGRTASVVAGTIAAVVTLAIAVPDAIQTLDYVLHPEYTFRGAAEAVAAIVRADKTHPDLVLSISGSDLTLMTGLPSIDDDFGTMELADRVKAYRPGWYAAWNELDDDKMDALTQLYNVERVAAFPTMDDPDRNLLILYRLDPTDTGSSRGHKKRRTPKPLVTKLDQQPSTTQLVH
ncbi:MAG: hypothetical protein M3R43_02845 [Acidobacteriota bacterium]|nr:hypothetical protein [Acidobacteriota bacterium]